MKKINTFLRKEIVFWAVLGAAVFCLGLAPLAFAANPTDTAFAGKGTAVSGVGTVHTNLSCYIVSAVPAGPARIQYIDASSDLATAKITFYAITNQSLVLTGATAAGGQNLWIATNTVLQSNDVLVIRSVANDQYQRVQLTNVVFGGTNFIIDPLNFAVTNGDLVYRCVASGTLGNNGLGFNGTNKVFTASGSAIYYGQEGYPLLMEISGTTCALNAVAGDFFIRNNRIR